MRPPLLLACARRPPCLARLAGHPRLPSLAACPPWRPRCRAACPPSRSPATTTTHTTKVTPRHSPPISHPAPPRRSFLRFSREVREDLSNYHDNPAWPLLLDNYVEWVQQSGQD